MSTTFKTFTNFERADYYIRINNYGYRSCTPGFSIGYVPRKHPIVHYVYQGELLVKTEGKSYPVKSGQAFLSFPDHVYSYTASIEPSCIYRWAEFSGINLEHFFENLALSFSSPIFNDSDSHLGKLLTEMTDKRKLSGKEINGCSWFLADILSSGNKTNKKKKPTIYEKYIEKAIEYICSNSENKTTVSDVADYLQIDRSYLSRVFNEHMGISIKKYIYNYHMDMAKNSLMYSSLSIKDIAASVGYDDPLDFTKAFHRTFGMSPSKWRNQNKISS